MAHTVIIDRARWVCDYCHDEQDYRGSDADEKARIGGALHKCPMRQAVA